MDQPGSKGSKVEGHNESFEAVQYSQKSSIQNEEKSQYHFGRQAPSGGSGAADRPSQSTPTQNDISMMVQYNPMDTTLNQNVLDISAQFKNPRLSGDNLTELGESEGFKQQIQLQSRVDNHLRNSNLNYIMRRSSNVLLSGRITSDQVASTGQGGVGNYRTGTYVRLSPRGNSLYKKQKQKTTGGAAGKIGSMKAPQQQYLFSPKSGDKADSNQQMFQKHMNPFDIAMSQITEEDNSLRISQPSHVINKTTSKSSIEVSLSYNKIQFVPSQQQEQSEQDFEESISNSLDLDGIMKAIMDNDSRSFRRLVFTFTNEQIVQLRFMEEDLNVLQTICFFNADMLIEVIKERFFDDSEQTKRLVDYMEPSGGNMALNFAVLTGNQQIIDFVLLYMKADAKVLTKNGLNLLHCAAQIDRGALSLMNFTSKNYALNVNQKDQFDCTPLHFAVINAQFKCVECLLALGADPNATNNDGQTSLHIAVQKYIQMNSDRKMRKATKFDDEEFNQQQEDEEQILYEDLKRIMKELLFNGARRDISGFFELSHATDNTRDSGQSMKLQAVTPYQLLYNFRTEIPFNEFKSLKIILDNYSYNQCLTTHRPLAQVHKDPKLMILTIILNILFFAFFIAFQVHYQRDDNDHYMLSEFRKWCIAAITFFVLTVFFYAICCIREPGFVKPAFDIVELLKVANDKSIDLENFCFYCRIIKSGRTFHCNFCKQCVEKFDHHCSFVNNCLGYRNHKFFLAFLVSYLAYFITQTVASFLSIESHENMQDSEQFLNQAMDVIFRVSSFIFHITQLIPLIYQLKEQTRKLCKQTLTFKQVHRNRSYSDFAGVDRSSSSNINGEILRRQTRAGGRSGAKWSFTEIVETKAGFVYNLKQIINYKLPRQEELRDFLFSESERFSTFVIKCNKRKELGLLQEDANLNQPFLKDRSDINKSISPPESFAIASQQRN